MDVQEQRMLLALVGETLKEETGAYTSHST